MFVVTGGKMNNPVICIEGEACCPDGTWTCANGGFPQTFPCEIDGVVYNINPTDNPGILGEECPCPNQTCHDPNSECKRCGTACRPNCYDKTPLCTRQCVPTCECKTDYILDKKDGICILETQCPL